MKANPVAVGSLLLLLGVPTAHAVPITIQVDYGAAPLDEFTCSSGFPAACDSFFASLATEFPATFLAFELDDSQRAVDGSYDVSSGLQGSLWDLYLQAVGGQGATALPITATAIAQGGLITDLLLNLPYTVSLPGVALQFALTGGSGAYSAHTSAFFDSAGFTADIAYTYNGAYDITQPPAQPGPGPVTPVPEPSTWVLMCTGLAILAVAKRAARPCRRAGTSGSARRFA